MTAFMVDPGLKGARSMQIIRHYEDVQPALKGAVYAIGNFDGVHIGHQKVIARTAEIAAARGAKTGVLMFEPHPRQYFFPGEPFFRLMSFRAKARTLAQLGVDLIAVLPFDKRMASMEPEDFIRNVLVEGLGASHVVAGYDSRFGKGRKGDEALLRAMSGELGYGVSIVEEVKKGEETYSSTRIRELLSKGEPRAAAELLGHWWTVETHVIKGDQRGRTIGFPTANLSLDDLVQPAFGVYAVRVEIEEGPHKGTYDGVANVGRRPTFGKEDVLLEVHIFDFDGDIYGAHLAVSFIEHLRDERKFDGLESLKTQIAADSARAREILAALG